MERHDTGKVVDRAVEALRAHFTNARGKPIRTPYYLSQLQVLHENNFFPWVVSDAVKRLTEEECFLSRLDENSIPELGELSNVSRISFYANTEALQGEGGYRVRSRILNIAKLVDSYSDPDNSEMLGKHLEAMVKAEIRAQGFKIVGEHSAEYKGNQWTKTQHNLDLIAELPNTKLAIGLEAKNTLDLMQASEIDIKIDICAALGIVPVFAVRWIKPYIECIRLQNGFSWVFKTQMYPLGQEPMVKKLYNKLSGPKRKGPNGRALEWPVSVRTELPSKSVAKFSDWVLRTKDNPRNVDTSKRCVPKCVRDADEPLEPDLS